MDDEALILWQDILDEIMAGRRDNLTCPYCSSRPLAVEDLEASKTKISCSKCGKFLEGRFGGF